MAVKPEGGERVEALVNHPNSNPDEETRNALMGSLTQVQASMKRLNEVKI